MLERPGGGLGHHVGDARRAPLGNDDAARAGGMRGADDGPQVVRVLDAIEHHQQVGERPRRPARHSAGRRP